MRLSTRQEDVSHPNAAGGRWGTTTEAPSFLYAMPLGGSRVFLEETCLVGGGGGVGEGVSECGETI